MSYYDNTVLPEDPAEGLLVGGENLVVMASFDPRECLKRRQRATMRWTDEAKAYKGRRKGLAKGLGVGCLPWVLCC